MTKNVKNEIRRERYEQYKKSVALRELNTSSDCSFDKQQEIREKQQEAYDKFLFYDKLCKAMDKTNNENNEGEN